MFVCLFSFLSCSGRDVEGEPVSQFSPICPTVDEDRQPGDEDRPPKEASDGRQNDESLHRLLSGERRPTKSVAEEPDGVDGPQEGQKSEPAEEVFLAKLNLVLVGHFSIGQIHVVVLGDSPAVLIIIETVSFDERQVEILDENRSVLISFRFKFVYKRKKCLPNENF